MDRELLERGGVPAPMAHIALRPAGSRDDDLLRRVYASSRSEELAQLGWLPEQEAHFLAMQFDLQDAAFRRTYPHASHDVIEVSGAPVGRLYVERGADDVRIIDIALLPEARGAGVGALLLEQLQGEARSSGCTVSLHVERHNRAGNLYRRLGFEVVGEDDVYQRLEWAPS